MSWPAPPACTWGGGVLFLAQGGEMLGTSGPVGIEAAEILQPDWETS